MLTGESIRAAGLVLDGLDAGYRGSSYDVHIEDIIADDGALRDSFKMPPQGIVQVISRERVRVPTGMTGLANVKTGLCNEGLLALNSGVIDPGYEGRISSFLLNFSNKPRLLTRGEAFLRLQFMIMAEDTATPPQPHDDDAYIAERRRQSATLSATFLNLEAVVEATTTDLFARWRTQILTIAGSVALILTALTFFLNWGSLYLVKNWLQPSDTVRAEILRNTVNDQTERLVKVNNDLRARIEILENQIKLPTSRR